MLIKEAREKPIVSMLEAIRRKFMERMQMKRSGMEKYDRNVHIWRRIGKTKKYSRNCFSIYAGNNLWEVKEYGSQFVVDVGNRGYTCRMWDINGIPWQPAVSCLELDRSQLEFFVHPFYQRKAYLDSYSFIINPMPSLPNWVDCHLPPLQPPPLEDHERKGGGL